MFIPPCWLWLYYLNTSANTGLVKMACASVSTRVFTRVYAGVCAGGCARDRRINAWATINTRISATASAKNITRSKIRAAVHFIR